jgi:hypothetical protein
VTFAEGVLRLVRAGARVDPEGDRSPAEVGLAATAEPTDNAFAVEPSAVDDRDIEPPGELSPFEPGFADIEAAVALVETGLATRVVLTGFPSWPGLLWQAYQLAEASNVLILPTVVRPGGRVDIVIARDARPDE